MGWFFAGMRTKTHRQFDAALLAVGVVLAGGAAGAGAFAGDGERVTALWAGARIGNDGRARIVEVIDYDFGSKRRHGIYRDVPELPPDADVVVRSATAPDEVRLLPTSRNETRIRIGDPHHTISGRHRYTIEYSLDTLTGEGRVAWDGVGTSWEVPLGDVEVHIVAPFELDRLRCFQGESGSTQPCSVRQPEPGHLVVRLGHLNEGKGVTLHADTAGSLDTPVLPAAPPGAADDPGAGLFLPMAVAAVAALAGAVPTSYLIRRAGRERVAVGGGSDAAWGGQDGSEAPVLGYSDDLAALATVEFAPPEELSPAQGGVLLADAILDRHKTAWLVQAAIDGYVDFEEQGSAVMLVRRDRRDGSAAAILDQAFAGRELLLLGAYDSSFAKAWAAVGDELFSWQRESGLWNAASERRKMLAQVLGVVVGAAGLVTTGLAARPANVHGPIWLLPVAVAGVLAGAGWAAFVRAWELRVKTVKGSGLWLRVESFRRFLARSEDRHAEKAAGRGVLREYTAWAVALGEVERWSYVVCSTGVRVADPPGMRDAAIATSLPSTTSSTSVVPSSGGGGSGAGGVGGGGGGGGGGSW